MNDSWDWLEENEWYQNYDASWDETFDFIVMLPEKGDL